MPVDIEPHPLLVNLDWSGYITVRLSSKEQWFIGGFLKLVKEFLDLYVQKDRLYACILEYSKNNDVPHVHAAFVPTVGINAVRKWVKSRGFLPEGNKGKAIRVGDRLQMATHFQYLMKGPRHDRRMQPNVVARHEYLTDALVQDLHERYYIVAKIIKDVTGKGKKRKREPSASEAILEICQQTLLHGNKDALSEDDIIEITVEWFHRNKQSLQRHHMFSVVDHVAWSLDPQSNRCHQLRNFLKYKI